MKKENYSQAGIDHESSFINARLVKTEEPGQKEICRFSKPGFDHEQFCTMNNSAQGATLPDKKTACRISQPGLDHERSRTMALRPFRTMESPNL
jgi:hypothetical protein